MRAILYGIPTAALALVIVAKTARAEVQVGMPIETQVVCRSQEQPATLIRSVETTGNYEKANEVYAQYVQAGLCVTFPYVFPAVVAEVGYTSKVFMDSDGDVIRITAARIEGQVELWVSVFEIIKAAGKS